MDDQTFERAKSKLAMIARELGGMKLLELAAEAKHRSSVLRSCPDRFNDRCALDRVVTLAEDFEAARLAFSNPKASP